MGDAALHTKIALPPHPLPLPKKGQDDDLKQITMTELMVAFAHFKAILNMGSVEQSKTMSNLFKAQDKSMQLSKQDVDKMVSKMESMSGEGKASFWLNIIGTIAAVVGTICMFVPGLQGVGLALLALSGCCMIASGGIQIDEASKMKKIAEQKGNMMKDNSVEKQAQTSVDGVNTQLKNTMSSKMAMEQVINAIMHSYGEASRSAAPQQKYYGSQ